MKRFAIKPFWVVLLLLLGLLQYQLWFQPSGVLKLMALQKEVAAGEEQNAELRARNDALKAEVARLKQDPQALEAEAREGLSMVKEGETYYRVVEKTR